jgi:hypothetical protein
MMDNFISGSQAESDKMVDEAARAAAARAAAAAAAPTTVASTATAAATVIATSEADTVAGAPPLPVPDLAAAQKTSGTF